MGQLLLEQGLLARDKLKGVDPQSADGIFYRARWKLCAITAEYPAQCLCPSRHPPAGGHSAIDIPEGAF